MLIADYRPTPQECRLYIGTEDGPDGPSFCCSAPGCNELFFEKSGDNTDSDGTPDPMFRCECGSWFCGDHVTAIKDLYFCEACARCQRMHNGQQCGDAAVTMCDECGDLLCAGDARGESGKGIHCKGGCVDESLPSVAYDPNDLEQFGFHGDAA